ncbi:hypothetical protein R5W24_002872 [Gemmata sp. JC717]|uniref:Uncharacterized protein n=1 Tax=Gemmata algarum TaxID=2975278 RepID=A0ABU5ESF6_9BACT|nr:hypothetical protein [Gemmata algarum]MDY3553758.1 hypothetical protein [Gemmata algarum]MDY3557577.1 hypothetical protein [Gemmata algarum]
MRRSHLLLAAILFAYAAGWVSGARNDRGAKLPAELGSEVVFVTQIVPAKSPGAQDEWRQLELRPHTVRAGGRVTKFLPPAPGATQWHVRIAGVSVCCEDVTPAGLPR